MAVDVVGRHVRAGNAWSVPAGWSSYENHFRALYSLYNVTATWLGDAATAGGGGIRADDLVLFVRPDTFLNCPPPFRVGGPQTLIVPKIGSFERELNDRVAVAGPYAGIAWGLRFVWALETCTAGEAVHAEKYLYNMAQAAHLNVHLDPAMMVTLPLHPSSCALLIVWHTSSPCECASTSCCSHLLLTFVLPGQCPHTGACCGPCNTRCILRPGAAHRP
jgi:hypothetical protein